MTSLSGGRGTYTYDANGNTLAPGASAGVITRVEGGLTYNQTFDAENRLISVTVSGQTTQFNYDGDGNLVKKVNPDNSKTIYVLGIYEVDKTSAGTVTQTRTYYPAGGAMRIGSTLYYVLKDHLSSASVITNSSGVTVSGGEQRYCEAPPLGGYPYGESRLTATMLTDKLFTGQREMAGLGIYRYGARFYSTKLGRFLSPDSIVPGYANPQAFNRYGYVLGNPLRYTDPSGHRPCPQGNCSSGPKLTLIRTAVQIDDGGGQTPSPSGGSGSGGNNNNNGNNGGNNGGGGNGGCNGIPDCGVNNEPGPVNLPYVPLDPGLQMETGGGHNYSTNSSGTAGTTSSPQSSWFTTPGYSVPEFVGGAILFGAGLGFTVFGAALGLIALGEVVFGAPTGPGEILIFPHALATAAWGGIFLVGGLGLTYVGYSAMKDAITP